MVQILLYRRLIGIGTPVGVMANVGDRGFMRCGAVWLIRVSLNPSRFRIVASGRHYTLHFASIKVCTVIRCLPIMLSGRGECGTD